MRSNTVAMALAVLGLGLTVAACSSPAAGSAVRPAGVTKTQHSASDAASSQRASGPSATFTTPTPPSITEPDSAGTTDGSENANDGAPSTYSPPPAPQATIDGWVAQFSNGAAFLGWTVTGSTVSGTYSETFLRAGDTRLTTDSASFSGSISGSSVTLTFSHGFGSTVSAQLTDDTLSMSVPQSDGSLQVQVYHPGTTADYNAQVQVVQASAAQLQEQSASAAAVAEQESASAASVASEESESSAAAAAVQQQVDDDQQAEQEALSSLTQDANFDSDLSSIAADVKSTAADLASTRTDAKDGGGDNCVNASSTVYNDAATTVYNDAATALYNDVLTLSNDIDTAKKDLADVQSAEKQLETDGVQGSADAPATIKAADGAIAAATTTANSDIDKVNQSVVDAYKVANSIATGPCAGMGPGDPPEPLAHI